MPIKVPLDSPLQLVQKVVESQRMTVGNQFNQMLTPISAACPDVIQNNLTTPGTQYAAIYLIYAFPPSISIRKDHQKFAFTWQGQHHKFNVPSQAISVLQLSQCSLQRH